MNESVVDSQAGRRYLRGLDFLWLEITPKCNLRCAHCYADSGPQRELSGEMTTDDWLRILAESAERCRLLP